MSQGTACTLSLVSGGQEPDVKEKSANQIAIWLPGLEEESFTTLKSYLMGERNVFEHPAESAKLNANFPYLTHIISEIKCLKDGPFLPAEVSKVFLSSETVKAKKLLQAMRCKVLSEQPRTHHGK